MQFEHQLCVLRSQMLDNRQTTHRSRLLPKCRPVFGNAGVSLNQFDNTAVAEKLAHLPHEEWLAHRPKPSAALIGKVPNILDRPKGRVPEG